MTLLLDTQALIWALDGDKRLSRTAQTVLENPDNDLFVSIVSGWEMTIKSAIHKLEPPIPLQALFPTELERQGINILQIQYSHLHRLLELPHHHRDPFDRMIIAQALSENLPVISSDPAFDDYGVRRIW